MILVLKNKNYKTRLKMNYANITNELRNWKPNLLINSVVAGAIAGNVSRIFVKC